MTPEEGKAQKVLPRFISCQIVHIVNIRQGVPLVSQIKTSNLACRTVCDLLIFYINSPHDYQIIISL